MPTITEYIKADLISRIRTDADLADRLTLEQLSEHYQVSLTPVRLAIRELIHEDFLVKRPNRRLEINRTNARAANGQRAKRAKVPQPPKSSRDWEKVLADEIIRKSLAGEAIYLREDQTAQTYGVGRTIVRQAFGRLAGSGMLEHLPRRGWRVRPLNVAELNAYLQVREALELKALELAQPHLHIDRLRQMLAGNLPRSGAKRPRLDNDLHRYLIEQSGNSYIRDFFDRHGRYFATLFEYAAPEARVVGRMARQHREILQALIDRDWRRARRALSHHIRAQRPVLERVLAKLGTPAAD